MTKIMVSGANGQLGLSLRDISTNYSHISFIFLSRKDLDISDEAAFDNALKQYKPDFYINGAAYTNVDRAESNAYKAILINGESLFHIGKSCANHKVKIIHISSDYVYHSEPDNILYEEDITAPKSVYAKSKLLGEHYLKKTNAQSIILRSSWIYSEHGHNFVKTMIRLSQEKDELNIVNDQFGSPTYARDLANVIVSIIERTIELKANWSGEIYNYCNLNFTNWYHFASFIFIEMDINVKLNAIPSSDYPLPATRPTNSKMSTAKIIADWGIDIRSWQDACSEMLIRYRNIINGKC